MMARWLVRVVASIVGVAALAAVAFLVHRYALKDARREMFRDGIAASAAIRQETGRDTNVRVDLAPGSDEQVIVTVQFPDPPADPATRRELIRNVNILARRHVHHVKSVQVLFDDNPEVLPSWDGGVAVAGTPEPIGVNIPPAIPSNAPVPQPPAPPAAAAADAGTTAKAPTKPKTGTVTLVTFPEADVFRGNQKVGRTPLFNAELPVGTHLLTLVGDDGKRRRLSVPVKVGKNKPLKMNLTDLPAR